MRWPFVGREAYDRLLTVMDTQRRLQDANLARERELHDQTRLQVGVLTETLAAIASPKAALPVPGPSISPLILNGIKDIARSDPALERMLLDRAKMCVAARPKASPSQVLDALRYGPDAIAEFLTPEEGVS